MPKPANERIEIAADQIEHMLAEWHYRMQNRDTGPDPGPLADYLASQLDEAGLLA